MAFQPLMDEVQASRSTTPITDASPHVDGGQSSTRGVNATASDHDMNVAHIACAIVIGALVLLWLMGALVFRSARL